MVCISMKIRQGVLTNNPPFVQQLFALNNYIASVCRSSRRMHFPKKFRLMTYSRGMGALGTAGRPLFHVPICAGRRSRGCTFRLRTDRRTESVRQFFHILGSVDQQRGCCEVADGKYEITIYTSCWNAAKGIYYYTTYDKSSDHGSGYAPRRIWTVRYLPAIRCWRKRSSGGRTDSR